jgi:hypothetical protein
MSPIAAPVISELFKFRVPAVCCGATSTSSNNCAAVGDTMRPLICLPSAGPPLALTPNKFTFPWVPLLVLQNLEVTVKASDAPLGLGKTEEVVAGPSPLSSSQAGGVTTITSLHPHTTSHLEERSHSAGHSAPQADVGQMLPSDDTVVYGGEGG